MATLLARLLMPSASPADRMLEARHDPSDFKAANSPYGAWVIDPIPSLQRKGLIAVSALALLSMISTVSLLSFLSYRFIFWQKYYRRDIGRNQYVVLIFNLALADFLQSIGFIVSLRWIYTDSLHAEDPSCFIQGISLQIGDPMSGMFVLAIALHTFMHVTLGRQLGHRAFVAVIVSLWVFGVLLVIIPIATFGQYVWVPSVAWCWMTIDHPHMRLWTHYFWIFAAQAFTLILYAVMFIQLHRRIAESSILGSRHTESLRRLKRVVTYMVIYPVLYIVLTLPLAAGRMASSNGNTPSVTYFCVAGTLMTLSGFCDTLLYTLTRRSLVLEHEAGTSENGYNKFSSAKNNKSSHTDPTMLGVDGKGPVSTVSAVHHRSDSTDAIVPRADVELAPMGGVYQQTTIEVTHEPAYPSSSSTSGQAL